jgi:hypothetical protein
VDDEEPKTARRAVPPAAVWLGALLVVVLLAWAGVTWVGSLLDEDDCGTPVALDVVAAPAIAPALAGLTDGAAGTGGAGGACATVRVTAGESAAVSSAIANPPPGRQPTVWIPESTFWLGRAQAKGAFALPGDGTPVALSPVVIAMTEPVAGQLGWPARAVPWTALLSPQTTAVPVGIPDPAADPIGVAGLIGVQAITASLPDAGPAETAVLRRLSQTTAARAAELYERLPGGSRSNTTNTISAFLTSEQALLAHNARQPAQTPLVASYPAGPVPTLDFPYVVLPGAGPREIAAATAFLSHLLAPKGRQALTAAGFRDPDGTAPGGAPAASASPSRATAGTAPGSAPASSGRAPASGSPTVSASPPADVPAPGAVRLDPVTPVRMPGEDDLVQVLSRWTGVQLSARILSVFDVSGSMNERIGAQTRMAVVLQAAQEGVRLLRETTDLGIWIFSTRLDGDLDYKVLVPPGPIAQQRDQLGSALAGIRAVPDGDTGLYDTTLAAYQEARRNWAPGRINLVFIATDGRNDDDRSISRAELLTELGKLVDPRRPLPILFMGLGSGVDATELREIASVVDGRVYIGQDAGEIRRIFFSALSDFGCQPPSCRR